MFISEPEPMRGGATRVTPKIQRVVAPNGGAMTYHGTNSYVVEAGPARIVIDPGPADPGHARALIDAAGGVVSMILLTHDHRDHSAGVADLARLTGAPVASARAEGLSHHGFTIDHQLGDGDEVAGVTAIATPGHAPDHLCFRMDEVIFTGDHVMGWAPSSVLAPEGDPGAYREGLQRLSAIRARQFLPGHGPAIRNTRRFLDFLIARLDQRERDIRDLVAEKPATTEDIITALYSNLGDSTRTVALRTIEAQLQQLERSGRIICDGGKWRNLQ